MTGSARILVLISGNGTNLQSLIDACLDGTIPGKIICVISNRKDAYGLTRAQISNPPIPTLVHSLYQYKKQYPNDESSARGKFDEKLAALVLKDKPTIVVCAGWMHILSGKFLDPMVEAGIPVINLHPALPGEYAGKSAIDRAWADWKAGKINRTGCMIHYVIKEVDMGDPIVTTEVDFTDEDEDIEKLKARIHQAEWYAIVQGTRIAIERLQSATPRESVRNQN